MTRKAFIADVTSASEKSIAHVSNVERGDDDGDVNFLFKPVTGEPINIALLALDVSGYPAENNYMIFTKSSDIPQGFNEALEDVAGYSAGMRVSELLQTVSDKLVKVLESGSEKAPITIDDDSDVYMIDGVDGIDEVQSDDSEENYDPGFDSDDDGGTFGYGPSIGCSSLAKYHIAPAAATILDRRIRQDLRSVKFAGFKIGILSGLRADSHNSILSISIQAADLGLSEEALQAWDLELSQYIILLVRYSSGYKSFDAVIAEPAQSLDITFKIGVSNRYKPTLTEALAAFTEVTQSASHSKNDADVKPENHVTESSGFASIFISSSLNDFVNNQFISLLKIRNSTGLGWDGAKHFFNDRQGRSDAKADELPPYYHEESKPKQSSCPDIMYSDHLTESANEISFPLIAAQFSMRYLLRCTEFCLVCHDRIIGDFEALKPYVCDKPLCLYQYMSLGFGPSIEHEILTQPYVVDLLVSFCYTAAFNQRLREYPTGMSLSVPPVTRSVTRKINVRASTAALFLNLPQPEKGPNDEGAVSDGTAPPHNGFDVKFDLSHHELMFDATTSCPVKNGDWIVITTQEAVATHHRVEDISLYPTVRLSGIIVTPHGGPRRPNTENVMTPATPATTPPPTHLIAAHMFIYAENFDDMSDVEKAETIVMLLSTLPHISELRAFLNQQKFSSEPNLRAWQDRVSPAALGMLRWIIASNRSCIVQVDTCPGQDEDDVVASKIRLDQKCLNVADDWLQFRFAQGSPDKEQRFLDALKAQQGSFDPKYPTMFAFHGSPLQNWHSIIRHGLDFKETMHGRAYGHGVYHAMDQSTSVGYAAQGVVGSWPASDLNVSSAMSLNEIVNCPSQFASSNPYMVVQHVDWIQARFLFVQVNTGGVRSQHVALHKLVSGALSNTPDNIPAGTVEQDPAHVAVTTMRKPIGVPLCAIAVSRAFRADTKIIKPTNKRRKHSSSSTKTTLGGLNIDDDEEIEDITFLFSDDDIPAIQDGKSDQKSSILAGLKEYGTGFLKSFGPSGNSKEKAPLKTFTDFVPGSLDQATLPMLAEPAYATSSATMRLQRDLKDLLKIQKSTPLDELGWYLDSDLINNVYQWIIELHSFDATLPLAKDMKKAGVTSIVLEIRFPKDYPHSPPFIRVIRPRFLPFTQGGGGHVTGGGAMCMELLTNSGWSSVSSIEGVLLQVRMAIMNLQPNPARLETRAKGHLSDYATGEAMEAYRRACRMHGWEVPKDFNDFAGGESIKGP